MSNRRKYQLNESFFDTWSPEVAYVLGFWFADGYMTVDRSYRITFCSNDIQILRDIRNALGSTNPIVGNNRDQSFLLRVNSKKLHKSLSDLGGFRCKSRTVTFPFVPKAYLRDFIRGYFDGDGSVGFINYIRTKDKLPTRVLRTNFTSGSRKFLEQLREILHEELGLPIKALGSYNDGSSLKLIYGMYDSDLLLNYMYYEGYKIALIRKAAFLFKIPKYQKHLSATRTNFAVR